MTFAGSLLRREVVPFYLALLALLAVTSAVDAGLHLPDLVWVGEWLGIPGVLLICGSFGYSLRKRKLISPGRPIAWMRLPERMACAGSLLLMVHAGIHFSAEPARLAIGAMLVNLANGLTGKVLLRRAGVRLAATTQRLRDEGFGPQALEDRLYWDSLTYDTVKQWRVIHSPITLALRRARTCACRQRGHLPGVVMKRWFLTLIAAALFVIVALAVACSAAMLAPGKLIPAHTSLAGNCFACHAPMQRAVATRCIRCHTVADIGLTTVAGSALPQSPNLPAFRQGLADTDCRGCHTDHLPASPTPARSRTFVHAMLPPAAGAACSGCHAPPVDGMHVTPVAQCSTCHTQTTWAAAAINHSRFLALTGEHDAACTSCHTTAGDFRQYTRFGCHARQETSFFRKHLEEGIRNIDNCAACHRDAHGAGGERGAGEERGEGGERAEAGERGEGGKRGEGGERAEERD